MAKKDDKKIADLVSKVEGLEEKVTELEETVVILNGEKEELEKEIESLPTKAEFDKALTAEPVKVQPKPEKTTKLFWLAPVDNSIGVDPKAFGLNLMQDEDENWYANVPKSRVKGELGRKVANDVSIFSKEAPVVEDSEE